MKYNATIKSINPDDNYLIAETPDKTFYVTLDKLHGEPSNNKPIEVNTRIDTTKVREIVVDAKC